ncbi:hypothetical protein CYY_009719 [Polysphondylium violaceum]|uniref:RING-type domain-containing protein n=1 Tax=Polysphondylium violaceum TaxID=133409 RepID=A0A8J4PL33_9MYCE|nr:hypothetical protein CYY_009719 [Polysphondylium violaceum]
MGNTQPIKKAENIQEFQNVVLNTNELIKNSKESKSKIDIVLKADTPNADIFKDTILWKLLTNVEIFIYNNDKSIGGTSGSTSHGSSRIKSTNNSNNSRANIILYSKLSFGQFYVFLNSLTDYFKITQKTHGLAALKQQQTLDEDDKLCPICFDKEASSVSGECVHAFCDNCITEWRAKNNTCPLCRNELLDKSDFLLLESKNDYDQQLVQYIQTLLAQIKK